MKRVHGTNVQVSKDETGGFIGVDWNCPYCGFDNYGFYFSSDVETMSGDFEVDHECEYCGKLVTIICEDAGSF